MASEHDARVEEIQSLTAAVRRRTFDQDDPSLARLLTGDIPWLIAQVTLARRDLDLYRQYEEKYVGQLAKMGIASHEFGAEVNRLRAAIQRAREAAAEPGTDATDAVRQAVGRILRALDGEVPDGN